MAIPARHFDTADDGRRLAFVVGAAIIAALVDVLVSTWLLDGARPAVIVAWAIFGFGQLWCALAVALIWLFAAIADG